MQPTRVLVQSILIISTTFYLDLSVFRPIFFGPLYISTYRRKIREIWSV